MRLIGTAVAAAATLTLVACKHDDITRIRLLELLNEGEATVQQLTDRLPTTHPNVSKHLSLLRTRNRPGRPLPQTLRTR